MRIVFGRNYTKFVFADESALDHVFQQTRTHHSYLGSAVSHLKDHVLHRIAGKGNRPEEPIRIVTACMDFTQRDMKAAEGISGDGQRRFAAHVLKRPD